MSSTARKLMSASGAGAGEVLNVEDVFSTYLYEGNSSTQTITNGIDLDGEGGLVWTKGRTSGATSNNSLFDTERGVHKWLKSNSTQAELTYTNTLTAFNSNGFTLGNNNQLNYTNEDYVSWTFRKAPKFFDVVTYTGNGTAGRTVSHNLGSVPGCIIVKCTDGTYSWATYHRSTGATHFLFLNSESAAGDYPIWNDTTPTDSVFTLGSDGNVNASGATYVAYLFAHNDGDGDFGPDGDADIIKCGSFTVDGSVSNDIDLGFEPQFIISKIANGTGSWLISDVMRGAALTEYEFLKAETSDAGYTLTGGNLYATSNGFHYESLGASGSEVIYIAIRRGTKVPESGTDVFEPIEWSYSSNGEYTLSNLSYMDTFWHKQTSGSQDHMRYDRLRGTTTRFRTDGAQEISDTNSWDTLWDNMNKFKYVSSAGGEWQGDQIGFAWKRAPSFFDVVVYEGNDDTSSARAIKHNLGVAPEMMIVKSRSTGHWFVYSASLGNGKVMYINFSNAAQSGSHWGTTTPTNENFYVQSSETNDTTNFMAYLFATLAGISKVGSVTHSGTTNVDCGFSSGARFVLLKRTDASGDWYVWDSVSGIIAGNDPYLLLNSSAAQVTNTDYIDPLPSGFTISDDFTDGTYIFYAIA